ncbi:MAG TPA: transporter substrate-binding domain-containing protein [Flavobacteriaceae bacterium]|nr:transporter substrate-binding domain-containing protein [Flavobacteriaceae bacterium]
MRYFPLLFLLLFFIRCDFPQDPNHSFEEAKQSGLKVGVAINPPFTFLKNGNLKGSEIELIKNFAEKKNLDLDFTIATESELIEQLEKHQLHVVVGGFDKKTIWNKKSGLSVPYDGKHVFLVGKGENKLLFELENFLFETFKKQ